MNNTLANSKANSKPELTLAFRATDPVVAKLTEGFKSAGVNVDFSSAPEVNVRWFQSYGDTRNIRVTAGTTQAFMRSAGHNFVETSLQTGNAATIFTTNGKAIGEREAPETEERRKSARRFMEQIGDTLLKSSSLG